MTRTLRLRDRAFELVDGRPLVMGIVNANPDSFSDATRLADLDAQVAKALELVRDGADLIDVGGESGVTYTDVSPEEVERDRVLPLVEALVAEGVVVSVDTWKAGVAEAALAAGAHLLNDVSGLRDTALADLAAQSGAGLVVMHTRADPKRKAFPDYGGAVVDDVRTFLAERCTVALEHGVARDRMVVDPGPDFAKSPAESVEVLKAWAHWVPDGLPWLAAVSRKYFLGAITGRAPHERLASTLGAVAWAADSGAAMLRVHDVREAVELLRVRDVLDGRADVPGFDTEDERLKWIRADGS
ncbi:dihydropteroate synthase [Conexibacter sp. SYSU D00693]|uniref:dihydropteroate synthase n=1 Tax=Conexibacter sp. SYSU D00693 TaxID=2812560 RepID=UPI001F11B0EF|nr:dihydropteroate synthase [Conexibacter sp. SYSU D00693]